MHNDFLCAVDNKQCVLLVLLDLSAAFDTVDHNILLSKLEMTFNIGGMALNWFKSYLECRKQTVNINDIKSLPLRITCGVPQGSILGPILFLCFMNDMPMSLKAELFQYADGSASVVTGPHRVR